MTYILCAFETEARALLDAFSLQKRNIHPFKLFYDEKIFVIISGMGQAKAEEAIEHLLLNFPNKKEDIFINIGTCAAQTEFSIGALVQVKQLQDETESHLMTIQNTDIPTVSCFSSATPVERPTATDIAEMEAMGIYNSIHSYFPLKQMSFLKIVSDNFNPIKHDKAFIIKLTQDNLPQIKSHIQNLQKEFSC